MMNRLWYLYFLVLLNIMNKKHGHRYKVIGETLLVKFIKEKTFNSVYVVDWLIEETNAAKNYERYFICTKTTLAY